MGTGAVRGPDQRACSVSGIYKTQSSFCKGFPGGAVVKNLAVTQETLVQSLGREDPLEKEMATHTSILARRIPWTEEIGGLQSKGSQGVLNLKVRSLKLKVSFNSFTMNCSK